MRIPLLAVISALALAGGSARAADFVGPEGCKGCHPAAYVQWRASKHARAMDSLTPEQQKEARCLSCHAPELTDRGVTGVSCETCHGGGQSYSPGYVMKDPELARLVGLEDPSEKSCLACHDASSPSLRPFEFAEKLKRIDHWSAEKKAQGAMHSLLTPPEFKFRSLGKDHRGQKVRTVAMKKTP